MLALRKRWSAVLGLVFLAATSCVLLWNKDLLLQPTPFTYERWNSAPSQPAFPRIVGGCSISGEKNKIPEEIDPCANFPTHRLQEIQIVLRTGIAERHRLATQLATFASCISNIFIVSDAEDSVAGHHVIDVLADLPASYNHYSNDDEDRDIWLAYHSQQDALRSGKPIEKSHEGWKLDRFKFLPMIDRSYRVAPSAKWFVFIETDIYFFWDTLFRILDRLDSSKQHYLGSPAPGPPNLWFAYGGAGIVLSGRLVQDLTQNGRQNLSTKYMDLAKSDPSGDAVLGYAINQELGAKLGHLYPSLPGEDLPGLRIDKEKWCVPLVGMHHVSEEEMKALWAWERCRQTENEDPVTYSTLLDFGIGPLISRNGPQSTHWNNGADGGGGGEEGGLSQDVTACAEACKSTAKCLQYSFDNDKNLCYQADYVQLGRAVYEDVTSGWDVKKLEELGFSAEMKTAPTCRSIKWLKPKKGKPFS